jgi:anti-sigma28 factor (negative regulator of flagellin synthesis)
MRITDHSLRKADTSRTEKGHGIKRDLRAGDAKSGASAGSHGEDTVATRNQDNLIAQAHSADAASREDRIQQLKAAFAAGSYHVHSVELSRLLIDDALTSGKGE